MTTYRPRLEPLAHQSEALDAIRAKQGRLLLAMDAGTGKALDVRTAILTRRGWVTIGDVRTGDQVVAPDGSWTTVLMAHVPYRTDDVWRLTFNNGEQVVADGEHLWVTDTYADRRRARRNGTDVVPTVRTTSSIVATLKATGGRSNHRIRKADPVRFEEAELPVDPYTLGVWLGDGTTADGSITLNHDDAGPIIGRLDCHVTRYETTVTDSCATYGTDLHRPLRLLGVLGDKHIPTMYLRASIRQRIELLRGLMDTDGHCDGSGVEVTQKSEKLARGILDLVRSLGESATLTSKRATIGGVDKGEVFRVVWTPRCFDPFHLARQARDMERRQGDRHDHWYITDAERARSRTVRCLTVDHQSSMFCVGSTFIPTHNTKTVLDYAAELAVQHGVCRMLVVSPLAAVDTWADEAAKHVGTQVRVVTHVISDGDTLDKAEQIESLDMRQHEQVSSALIVAVPTLHIVSVNVDVLSQSLRVRGRPGVTRTSVIIDALRSHRWDLGVMDESHRIKGRNAMSSRQLQDLVDLFPRRLALTGTVAPNGPHDVWAQMAWVEPSVLGSWAAFEREHRRFLDGQDGKVDYAHLGWLSMLLDGWVYVAKRREVLDLPEPIMETLTVDLSADERQAYDEMARRAAFDLEHGPSVSVHDAVLRWAKLRQLASGFVHDAGMTYIVGDTKRNAAIDKSLSLLKKGEKVVIFGHYRVDIDRTADMLQARWMEHGHNVMSIHGDTPADERRRLRKRFRDHDGPCIMVAQMRSVGLSVNEFVVAQHAIFLSFSERHDDYLQALGRLDRNGQTGTPTFWHVVARDTVDEAILESYARKGTLEEAVLAEARRVTDDRRYPDVSHVDVQAVT